MHVWLNGKFILAENAQVSAFDAGFQHAVGLFETMLARGGRIFRVRDHMLRLRRSAEELRLVEDLNIEALADAALLTIEKNTLNDARIRLTLSGGDLNLLARDAAARPRDPTILIHVQPPTRYPGAFFEQGVTVTIADARLNPLNPFEGHKTLNYWPRLSALQAAATVGAGEAVWFTVTNHLASGSVSNIFLVKDGVLQTPIARGEEEDQPGSGRAIPAPVMPGITRDTIIDIADRSGIPTHKRMLTYDDLSEADEVFLTNSSWGVLPVAHVERQRIGGGGVGEMTQRLRAEWIAHVTRPEHADAS